MLRTDCASVKWSHAGPTFLELLGVACTIAARLFDTRASLFVAYVQAGALTDHLLPIKTEKTVLEPRKVEEDLFKLGTEEVLPDNGKGQPEEPQDPRESQESKDPKKVKVRTANMGLLWFVCITLYQLHPVKIHKGLCW